MDLCDTQNKFRLCCILEEDGEMRVKFTGVGINQYYSSQKKEA